MPNLRANRRSFPELIRRILNIGISFSILILTGCNMPLINVGVVASPDAVTKVQIVFTVQPLKELADGETLELVIVDEVTGIPFHQELIGMNTMPDGFYGTVYEARVGSLITYLFYKIRPDGARIPEVAADWQPIRYRLYYAAEPGVSREVIAGWEDDLPEINNTGHIRGKVVEEVTGDPLADILVTSGGVQSLTDASGNFVIYPLPAGEQNLVATSMSGQYQVVQKRAEIDGGKVTPAEISMKSSIFREVTFTVQVPEDTIQGAPIRIAGNLAQLGNTFLDLGGGVSGDTRQMPILSQLEDGLFGTTLILPEGIDIRYKYTLGDGFWNAEHKPDLGFITHQLIIPEGNDEFVIEDQVATWRSDSTETIWFQASVPDFTPVEEPIGIQFRIAEWMPALPMFKTGVNTWAFPLISPHNFSGEIPYRYCRSAPCIDHFQAGVELFPEGRSSVTDYPKITLKEDTINGWAFLKPTTEPTLSFPGLPGRDETFIAGIGLAPAYTPNQESFLVQLLTSTHSKINHVLVSPAWEAVQFQSPQTFGPSLMRTPRWQALGAEVQTARNQGLEVSLFPTILFDRGSDAWWDNLPTDEERSWQKWLGDYQQFIDQFAAFAGQAEVDVFVLGGHWLDPALPIEDHPDRFNQPGNMVSLWRETIESVRESYPGQIGWMLTIATAADPPDFLKGIDVFYLIWDQPLAEGLSQDEWIEQVGEQLDEIAAPLVEKFNKPLIVLISVPSILGYGEDCIPSPFDSGGCVDTSTLIYGPSVLNPDSTDLEIQSAYYHAILSAVAERDWISGVISQGYYPPLALHDTATSIHGKPAENLYLDWLALVLGN